MITSFALSLISGNIEIFLAVIFVSAVGLVFYALYKKGDVRAVFSHGRTVFRLEAKERNPSVK